MKRFVHVVYSTEELRDLQERAEKAGGQIVSTSTHRCGAGISAEVKIDDYKNLF